MMGGTLILDIKILHKEEVKQARLGGSLRHLDVYTPLLRLINKVNKDFYGFDLTDPEPMQQLSTMKRIKAFIPLTKMEFMMKFQ